MTAKVGSAAYAPPIMSWADFESRLEEVNRELLSVHDELDRCTERTYTVPPGYQRRRWHVSFTGDPATKGATGVRLHKTLQICKNELRVMREYMLRNPQMAQPGELDGAEVMLKANIDRFIEGILDLDPKQIRKGKN